MHKGFLTSGALLAALGVICGAFAAHGLKKIVPPETVQSFQTGAQYQIYHSLALLVTGILFAEFPKKLTRLAGIFFLCGIVLFSGSLYLLAALKATETIGLNKIGLITPIGGILFVAGWLMLFIAVLKKK